MSDSVSISNRISQEKKSLERLFALIGEAVYKDNPDTPKAGLEDEWAAVKVAYANIASYTEQLNNIKGLIYCPNCGRPAADGDKFCAKCGFKLNIRPESTGVKMAKDLKEAGQEVGRIAGGAADKTGEAVGGAAAGTKNAFSWLKGKLSKPKKDEDAKERAAEAGRPDVIRMKEPETGSPDADRMKTAEEEHAKGLRVDLEKEAVEKESRLDDIDVIEGPEEGTEEEPKTGPEGESPAGDTSKNVDVEEEAEEDIPAEDTPNGNGSSDAALSEKEDLARQGGIFRGGQAEGLEA